MGAVVVAGASDGVGVASAGLRVVGGPDDVGVMVVEVVSGSANAPGTIATAAQPTAIDVTSAALPRI
ncbi:hypothetical protein [Mycolicibacter sinensis]|uniref:Uncharacterized protein n=1 Tax=Mycolicibacter sinensis (strain JDM601) TaxID=875328 RepID=A0A1A2NTG6_MYCSD|nr:hypothetical protein [Mycolicibacter sinensis]OBH18377.1 hypothetical protein A5694_21925 [Mycolicibacter sinensis]OBI29399.1 hypothetical protein A5710_21880 [Mycolicibacter sinensis]